MYSFPPFHSFFSFLLITCSHVLLFHLGLALDFFLLKKRQETKDLVAVQMLFMDCFFVGIFVLVVLYCVSFSSIIVIMFLLFFY